MKEYITGIGGVFFRSKDKSKTLEWYHKMLGLKAESWGKVFAWREEENTEKSGSTTWCPFASETDYFGNSGQEFMVNYIVRDMDELLQNLKESGINPVKAPENHEYGKFAWIEDCDGRRIELWEPA